MLSGSKIGDNEGFMYGMFGRDIVMIFVFERIVLGLRYFSFVFRI